jgi:hypothetical protein
VLGRDVQKHAPPIEAGSRSNKRSGLIGLERIPSPSRQQEKRAVPDPSTDQQRSDVDSPMAAGHQAAIPLANDVQAGAVHDLKQSYSGPRGSAIAQLKPRNTPKSACLRKRGRKGRALEGRFGKRSAEGKSWFLA